MTILNVVGARPNFVKMAPLIREMRRHSELAPLLVHTGQHYDESMSERLFADLELPPPDFNLGVGSGSHATQTADVMRRLEPILQESEPDLVLVVGDVNSTLGAALTAVKLGIRVAHVEAGLRSFDRSMPEEINRALTDAIADLLFTTEPSAMGNLLREGVAEERIYFVGNVMIDALYASRSRWEKSEVLDRLGVAADRPYAVVTLHRPSNVDDPCAFRKFVEALQKLGHCIPVIFPVHPRVRRQVVALSNGIIWVDALGYLDFIALISRARVVLTDSGGVQEETTILGVPCLTLRDTTERPVTVTHGTNRIIGSDPARIVDEALRTVDEPPPIGRPPLWDGQAACRIVGVLLGRVGGATHV